MATERVDLEALKRRADLAREETMQEVIGGRMIPGYALLKASELDTIIAALERAERVKAAARACIEYWTADGTFDDYVGPEEDLRAALAAAPEGSDGD